MKNLDEVKKVIDKVLELNEDREELERYLWSLEKELVYELYAVYYCGRDGIIELSLEEDFEWNLEGSKRHQLNELINKIKNNPQLTNFLPKGRSLLKI